MPLRRYTACDRDAYRCRAERMGRAGSAFVVEVCRATWNDIFFVDSSPQHPILYGFICAIRSKNKVVIFPSFSHKLCRLLRYVEIFLPFCFLLAENYSSEIPLLENIFPMQYVYIVDYQ